mmetsp:Transcript_24290/g.68216  ORF Transcript_24290/g.68216 Transcript_24290/m.68216 type:complete len:221 (+) Transcript_24290:1208-1870(+)
MRDDEQVVCRLCNGEVEIREPCVRILVFLPRPDVLFAVHQELTPRRKISFPPHLVPHRLRHDLREAPHRQFLRQGLLHSAPGRRGGDPRARLLVLYPAKEERELLAVRLQMPRSQVDRPTSDARRVVELEQALLLDRFRRHARGASSLVARTPVQALTLSAAISSHPASPADRQRARATPRALRELLAFLLPRVAIAERYVNTTHSPARAEQARPCARGN